MLNKLNRIFASLTLAAGTFLAVPVVQAMPLKEFFSKPKIEQSDIFTASVEKIIADLNSEHDSKGNLKSASLLKSNRDLAVYVNDLLLVREGEKTPRILSGIPDAGKLFYAMKDLDPNVDHEKVLRAFIKDKYVQYLSSAQQANLGATIVASNDKSKATPTTGGPFLAAVSPQ